MTEDLFPTATRPADPGGAGGAGGAGGTGTGTGTELPRRARQLWRLLEPVHAVLYFTPHLRPRFEEVGLKGFWMAYFASRSAALGPVGPEVVEATFYVFNPVMVARALPDAWRLSSPEAVLEVRAALAGERLRAALGDLAGGEEVRTAAELAALVARAAPRAGRPLGAAHAGLPEPTADDPVGRLWWAATVLREHRGDGHVAALVGAGVDPCAALVLAAASGAAGPQGAALLRTSRRWSDADWSAATARLAARGWLRDDGGLTPAGLAARQSIEDTTDRAAGVAYAPFGADELDALAAALRPLTTRIAESGAVPYPNPVGLDPHPDSETAAPASGPGADSGADGAAASASVDDVAGDSPA